MSERSWESPVGVVLGSEDAGPLEFWVGVSEGRFLQLDDLVTVEAVVDGESVSFFGIVDVVRKRYEGAQFDSDAFRASEGILPVDVSYAAHVQVTRIDPEVFVPPHPGSEVRIVGGEQFRRALFIDRMERKVAIGGTRAGETVYANLDFLDGERGAHASISGISGVATKTSYATFLLYSLFHSDALGRDAANARAIIFNVKGEDLLWLDKQNAKIDEDAAAGYRALGLNAGPFEDVGFFAPTRRHGEVLIPEIGSRHEGVRAYAWTLPRVRPQPPAALHLRRGRGRPLAALVPDLPGRARAGARRPRGRPERSGHHRGRGAPRQLRRPDRAARHRSAGPDGAGRRRPARWTPSAGGCTPPRSTWDTWCAADRETARATASTGRRTR